MALINCTECGHLVSSKATSCPACGCPIEHPVPPPIPNPKQTAEQPPQQHNQVGVFDEGESGKSRGVAAILAFFLGSLGIHFFYLGKTGAGVFFLLLTILFCWTVFIPFAISIITIIQAVLFLTSSQEQFESKYIYSNTFLPI